MRTILNRAVTLGLLLGFAILAAGPAAAAEANKGGNPVVVISTSLGDITVELNAEKIRDCMLARKRQGRWPHPAPLGYLNRKTDDGSRKWIEIDPERNAVRGGEPRIISTDASTTTVLVVPTNEELAIARAAKAVVSGAA